MRAAAKGASENRIHGRVFTAAMRALAVRNFFHPEITTVALRSAESEIFEQYFSVGSNAVAVPYN